MGRGMGAFSAGKGKHYVLDMEVMDDGSSLNPGHPHLIVTDCGAMYRRYDDWSTAIFLMVLLFACVGSILIIQGILMRTQKYQKISFTASGPQRVSLIETETLLVQHPQEVSRQSSRLPASAWLGIFAIAGGLLSFAVIQHRLATRIFVPFNRPVLLERDHIKTGPFLINVHGTYSVSIGMNEVPNPKPGYATYSTLRARWILYRNGNVAVRHDDEESFSGYLGEFEAGPGIYDLDLEVLSDAGCLNSTNHRLKIETSRSEYMESTVFSQWLSLLALATGASLLLLSGFLRFRLDPAQAIGFDDAHRVYRYLRRAQTQTLKPGFSGFASFGVVASVTYFCALAPIWILTSLRPMMIGFKVSVARPDVVVLHDASSPAPLIVRIKVDAHRSVSILMNSASIPKAAFKDRLKQELRTRPPHDHIYISASLDVDWQDVVDVVDTIQGEQANPVLLSSPEFQHRTNIGRLQKEAQ